MARPRSEAKRQAILEAAAICVAEEGIGAATSRIAKMAGVAEGTVFAYFATKDVLLDALLAEIETDLASALHVPDAVPEPSKANVRFIWDGLVDWSVANPAKRAALRTLKLALPLDEAARRRGYALFRDARAMVEDGLIGHADPAHLPILIDTILFGLADLVVEAIQATPDQSAMLRQLGFDLFWNGAARSA